MANRKPVDRDHVRAQDGNHCPGGPVRVCDHSSTRKLFVPVLGMLLILTGQSGCSGGYNSSPTPTPTPTPTPNATFDLVSVATGFTNPEDVEQPNDGSGRLFVVEQGGRIQIIR